MSWWTIALIVSGLFAIALFVYGAKLSKSKDNIQLATENHHHILYDVQLANMQYLDDLQSAQVKYAAQLSRLWEKSGYSAIEWSRLVTDLRAVNNANKENENELV